METENASQQTDWSLGTNDDCTSSRCYKCCSKLGVCISLSFFISVALLLAIVFLGRNRIQQNLGDHFALYPKRVAMYKSLREVNLKVTTISKFPFVGALISISPVIFLCPLIIITDRYLLTGANCFTTNFQNLSIRVGSTNWNKDGYIYEIDTYIINDKFNFTTMENNLAIVRLKKILKMDRDVKKTKLRFNFNHSIQRGTVVGWNMWTVEDYPFTTLLEQTKLIWNDRECKAYLKRNTNLICVISNSEKCTLLDLTGSLIMDNEVVGFWSSGISCLHRPSLYTNLIHHREWIERIILH